MMMVSFVMHLKTSCIAVILISMFVAQDGRYKLSKWKQVIIIIINPLTARVVGAPQMILHHLVLGQLQACPFLDVVFPPLPLSALSSFPFHCALQDGFGQT